MKLTAKDKSRREFKHEFLGDRPSYASIGVLFKHRSDIAMLNAAPSSNPKGEKSHETGQNLCLRLPLPASDYRFAWMGHLRRGPAAGKAHRTCGWRRRLCQVAACDDCQ